MSVQVKSYDLKHRISPPQDRHMIYPKMIPLIPASDFQASGGQYTSGPVAAR